MTRPNPQYLSADGLNVKLGDIVWRVLEYGLPKRKTVNRDTLRYWHWWALDKTAYLDEEAALVAALNGATKRLARAKAATKTEQRTATKVEARLRGLRTKPTSGEGG